MMSWDREEAAARHDIEIASASWHRQLQQLRDELDRRDQRHDDHVDLHAYLVRRIAEEADTIAPELIDYIGGSTADEVEQSITMAKQKTANILEGVRQAQARPSMPSQFRSSQRRSSSSPPSSSRPWSPAVLSIWLFDGSTELTRPMGAVYSRLPDRD
jgi:hypothetical protein